MNTVELYNQISQKYNWMPELKPTQLKVDAETIENHQAWSFLTDFAPTKGWIQTLDDIFIIQNDLPKSEDIVISAELINAQGQSLHLRPTANEQLIKVLFTPNQGENYLMTESTHQIKKGKQTGEVTYGLYWETGSQATQAQFSRLINFTLQEGQ